MSNIILMRLRESHALVGLLEEKTTDAYLLSAMAKIRYWGTTKGFEELVGGPAAKTICDVAAIPRGTLVEVLRSQVIYVLPGDKAKWSEVLRVAR